MIRQEQWQCDKVCRVLDDVLANRPTERDSLIIATRKAFEALEEAKWIPCSERLPEESGRYLVSVLDGVGRRATVAPYQPRYKAWIEQIVNRLRNDPDAEWAEIVRCKDCRYYQDNNGGYPHDDCKWNANETPDVDDFCSGAERRTDE